MSGTQYNQQNHADDTEDYQLTERISPELVNGYRPEYADTKVPSVWTPFWYMKSESFWHFKSVEDDDLLHGLLAFAGHPSIGQMRLVIKYAYLDKALFGLLENDTCR